jgi:hypothetical protein
MGQASQRCGSSDTDFYLAMDGLINAHGMVVDLTYHGILVTCPFIAH